MRSCAVTSAPMPVVYQYYHGHSSVLCQFDPWPGYAHLGSTPNVTHSEYAIVKESSLVCSWLHLFSAYWRPIWLQWPPIAVKQVLFPESADGGHTKYPGTCQRREHLCFLPAPVLHNFSGQQKCSSHHENIAFYLWWKKRNLRQSQKIFAKTQRFFLSPLLMSSIVLHPHTHTCN